MEQESNNKQTAKHGSQRLAEQYNESHSMILKDMEVVAAIDIIGEYSPAAKRKILSGEVKIDKQVLKSLSALQKDDIHRFVMEIENGSFEKKPPPKVSNQFKHSNTEMRSTLRKCINMLENLHRQL